MRKICLLTSNGINVIDYSEKAIAIVGNTRPLAAMLRNLGGKFNSRLSCGAGWVFPTRKQTEIIAALGL